MEFKRANQTTRAKVVWPQYLMSFIHHVNVIVGRNIDTSTKGGKVWMVAEAERHRRDNQTVQDGQT